MNQLSPYTTGTLLCYLMKEDPILRSTNKKWDCTWSRAGGRTSVQSDVRLSGALRLWVVARHLLRLWHRHNVLSATVWGWGGHQQWLLGRGGGRRQVQGSDLLSHQLLLDLVNEHQVIQLKGLTGHAQQKTATVCECHSCSKNTSQDREHLTARQYKIHYCLIFGNKLWRTLSLRVCFTDGLVLNGWTDIHTWKHMAIKCGNVSVIICYEWTYLAWHGWRRRPEIWVVKSRLRHPETNNIYCSCIQKSSYT